MLNATWSIAGYYSGIENQPGAAGVRQE